MLLLFTHMYVNILSNSIHTVGDQARTSDLKKRNSALCIIVPLLWIGARLRRFIVCQCSSTVSF